MKNFIDESDGNAYEWTLKEFEEYLDTKEWSEETKNIHRKEFKGYIKFEFGSISYFYNKIN